MRLFTQHPAEVGETYGEHMANAFRFGARMVVAGCACILHGVFPFLFVKTGSRTVAGLHEAMVTHRDARRRRLHPGWLADPAALI